MFISRFHPNKTLQAFGADQKGLAAVEFGMIAPVILVMMLGLIETGRALVMARRFNLVTAVASDLVARSQTMNDGDLDGIAKAVALMWQPYDNAPLNFTVQQIRAAGPGATVKTPGTTYVDWSRQYVWTVGSPARFVGSNINTNCPNKALPNNMVANGGSTILVEANYTFAPLFAGGPLTSNIMPPSTWNWTAASTHVPRNLCVDYHGNNCLAKPGCETP
jgi:Flp pilus assembly protein TadG